MTTATNNIEWTPESIFSYMEQHSQVWRKIYEDIKSSNYIINETNYPKTFSFKTLLYEYFQSGAHKIFNKECSLRMAIDWVMQNRKVNKLVRHPLTGDTIWHQHCILAEILIPPIYDRKLNCLLDVYASHKDDILALQNFNGTTVFSLLRDLEHSHTHPNTQHTSTLHKTNGMK